MINTRTCTQCGADFLPPREHARFCSPGCRIAWNRQCAIDPAPDDALPWAISAMNAATDRLLAATTRDPQNAFMLISEAVWGVTLVDATLVRYHDDSYGRLLAGYDPAGRQAIEDTFAGLRFVRNQIGFGAGPDDLICPPEFPCPLGGSVAGWTWKPVAEHALVTRAGPGQDWELARYRAYQARLARHPVRSAFGDATAFLHRATTAIAAPPPAGCP